MVSALDHIARHHPSASRVIIYTDNLNTIHIFSSLHCLPEVNHLLLHATDTLVTSTIDLRVLHIPGEQNMIADAISHLDIGSVVKLIPEFCLGYFQPPRFTKGTLKS